MRIFFFGFDSRGASPSGGPCVPGRRLSFALMGLVGTKHSNAFVVRDRQQLASAAGRTDKNRLLDVVLLSPPRTSICCCGDPSRRLLVAAAAAHTILQENRHPSAQEPTYCDEASHREDDALLFQQLCREANVVPADALRLDVSTPSSSSSSSSPPSSSAEKKAEFDGAVRGVYVTRPVRSGDVVVSIPLASCLRDDEPPLWYDCASASEHKEGDEEETQEGTPCMIAGSYNPSGWATRLAASLLHEQLLRKTAQPTIGLDLNESTGLWLRLLPDPDCLRSSLPVHWPSAVLRSACCTSLEMAADAAYFSRAQAAQDLTSALLSPKSAVSAVLRGTTPEQLQRMCEDALDVVQTRSCRASVDLSPLAGAEVGVETTTTTTMARDAASPLRILAPVFDMINHSNRPNADFFVQCIGGGDDGDDGTLGDGSLVVRALRDLRPGDQVLIDYGPSARPAYRCLASYGFVPALREDDDNEDGDDAGSEEEEEDVAEVYIDGSRYEVTRTSVPEDIVLAAAASPFSSAFVGTGVSAASPDEDEEPVRLTPDVAIRLATRLSDVAYQLLLNPLHFLAEDADDEEGAESPNDVLSARLAASLRWNQHRILLACALRLRDWAVGGSNLP